MKETYEFIQRRSLAFRSASHIDSANVVFAAMAGLSSIRKYFPVRGLGSRLRYCYHCKSYESGTARAWLLPYCERTACVLDFNKRDLSFRSCYVHHLYPMAQWVSMLDLSTLPPLSCTQAIQLLKRCFPVSTWEALGNNLLLKLQTRTTDES